MPMYGDMNKSKYFKSRKLKEATEKRPKNLFIELF